jgi:mono/diheme cytochrome c family protein
VPTASTEPGPAAGRVSGRRVRIRLYAGVGGALLLAALAALAPLPAGADSPSPADPDDAAQIARGAAVYAGACASCHGARLEGQADWRSPNPDGTLPAPPHDAEGHTWHHPDGLIFRYTRLGGGEVLKGIPGVRSAMPGFSDTLSDQDIWDVLAFIKSHWPEEMRAYQRAATENER